MSNRPMAPGPESEQRCVEYARTGDRSLRDQIVQDHQWLVEICARRMLRRGESLEDLIQVANMGVIQAIDRFDPDLGVTFRTYASATIIGLLRRHYRTAWRVHVPRRLQELNLAVNSTTDRLTNQLHRSPTVAEIAAALHIEPEDVLEAMEAGESYWPSKSLSNLPGFEVDPVVQDDRVNESLDRHDVTSMLAHVPDRTRTVLYMRFYMDMTQSEIGSELGLSQVHVSRLERRGIAALRTRFCDRSPAS
jgi:RNA polymerase sigma-B factor